MRGFEGTKKKRGSWHKVRSKQLTVKDIRKAKPEVRLEGELGGGGEHGEDPVIVATVFLRFPKLADAPQEALPNVKLVFHVTITDDPERGGSRIGMRLAGVDEGPLDLDPDAAGFVVEFVASVIKDTGFLDELFAQADIEIEDDKPPPGAGGMLNG